MMYSEFVKAEMAKLKSKDMTAPQKMKMIAEKWRAHKGMSSKSEMPKKEMPKKEMSKKSMPKKVSHSDEILQMMGVDLSKQKKKPKSKMAEKKIVKAMEKMSIPMDEEIDMSVKHHPVHLLEEKKAVEEMKKKHFLDDDDDDNNIGF